MGHRRGLLEGLAKGEGVVGLVAAGALGSGDEGGVQRLIGKVLGIAFGRCEDVGLVVGHGVGRVGGRDVGVGLHRCWDARGPGGGWEKV